MLKPLITPENTNVILLTVSINLPWQKFLLICYRFTQDAHTDSSLPLYPDLEPVLQVHWLVQLQRLGMMHWQGTKPRPPTWQSRVLPLNHQCTHTVYHGCMRPNLESCNSKEMSVRFMCIKNTLQKNILDLSSDGVLSCAKPCLKLLNVLMWFTVAPGSDRAFSKHCSPSSISLLQFFYLEVPKRGLQILHQIDWYF